MWLPAGHANRTGGHLLYRDIHAPLDLLPELAASVHWQRELILLTTNWQQSGHRLLPYADPHMPDHWLIRKRVFETRRARLAARLEYLRRRAASVSMSVLATQMLAQKKSLSCSFCTRRFDLAVNLIASFAKLGHQHYILLVDNEELARHCARRGALRCVYSSLLDRYTQPVAPAGNESSNCPASCGSLTDSRTGPNPLFHGDSGTPSGLRTAHAARALPFATSVAAAWQLTAEVSNDAILSPQKWGTHPNNAETGH